MTREGCTCHLSCIDDSLSLRRPKEGGDSNDTVQHSSPFGRSLCHSLGVM